MFEAAKVGRRIEARDFDARARDLRARLLEAQALQRARGRPLIVVISGMEAAGKGAVVNRLNQWLDARALRVHAFWDPSDEETERPHYWRFWRCLPAAGEIAVMFGGWYQAPLEQQILAHADEAELDRAARRIRAFERMLIEDGTGLLKCWYHFPEALQRERLERLGRERGARWQMLPAEGEDPAAHFDRFERAADALLRRTDTGRAPWQVIEASDVHYRDLATGDLLLTALERLGATGPETWIDDDNAPEADDRDASDDRVTHLDSLDLSHRLAKPGYRRRRDELQAELDELTWQAWQQRRSIVVVFEGMDAAGKGGAIRRITQAVDARLCRVVHTDAPSDEERAHHYLWRFWRQIPRAGHTTIFDRSWYGRVLVERVEGITPPHRWRRAYREINEFEQQLVEHGMVVVKFWLQISPGEQLRRFRARERTPWKRYKLTDEDWRNREHGTAASAAANEMIERTSTASAPWHLIPGEDKRFARIEVLERLTDAIGDALEASQPAG